VGSKVESTSLIKSEAASLKPSRLAPGDAFLSAAQPTQRNKDDRHSKCHAEEPEDDFPLRIGWGIWSHLPSCPCTELWYRPDTWIKPSREAASAWMNC